jgi:hypothetical protein
MQHPIRGEECGGSTHRKHLLESSSLTQFDDCFEWVVKGNIMVTKKMRVLRYMSSGRGLTASEARSRFNVRNFRSMISDINSRLPEGYAVTQGWTSNNTTRYFISHVVKGRLDHTFDVNQMVEDRVAVGVN